MSAAIRAGADSFDPPNATVANARNGTWHGYIVAPNETYQTARRLYDPFDRHLEGGIGTSSRGGSDWPTNDPHTKRVVPVVRVRPQVLLLSREVRPAERTEVRAPTADWWLVDARFA